MSEYDYDKELKIFCVSKGIWNEKENRPNRFVINKLKTITVINPDGSKILQNAQDGFTTKRIKLTHCRSCFKKLEGKQKQYCSTNCKQNVTELKKKFVELQKENKELLGITWTQNPDGSPEWKNVKGHFNKNGKYYEKKNIITKKSGHTRSKDY